jgi:NAD(P)-dependent dehydrogenase (short-subunit alcohol dehydrogenase family)
MTPDPDAPIARPDPGPDLFRLDGKVALVTGAGGELASATALGFARAGASLVLTDRDEARLAKTAAAAEALGAACIAVPSDSSDQESIDRVFAALDERFGRLDVLLNAAGINPMQGRPEDFPMDIWAFVIDVNLTGYLRFAKAAGQRMIDGGRGGSIINISSISGTSALGRGNLAYGVSKAGVDQMTRELAVEWAWRGIRVNSIQPCQFLNDGLRALIADPDRRHLADHMVSGIPIGRMGRADEMVGPMLFLASDASSMVTGVNLPVDGGNRALNAGGTLPRA